MPHRFTSEEMKAFHAKRKAQRQKRLLEISSNSSISESNVLEKLEEIFKNQDEKLPLLTGKE